jgi:hypothetical protein
LLLATRSHGSAPQHIATDSTAPALTPADLGIRRREPFTVTERSESTTPKRAKSPLDEAVKVDIPGDNSCLFGPVD